ncbi:hypothetical protein ACOSP7_017463 [Xanthoceras sorbifolium]
MDNWHKLIFQVFKQSKPSMSRCTSNVAAPVEQHLCVIKPPATASSKVVHVPNSTQLHGEQAFTNHSTQKSVYSMALEFG